MLPTGSQGRAGIPLQSHPTCVGAARFPQQSAIIAGFEKFLLPAQRNAFAFQTARSSGGGAQISLAPWPEFPSWGRSARVPLRCLLGWGGVSAKPGPAQCPQSWVVLSTAKLSSCVCIPPFAAPVGFSLGRGSSRATGTVWAVNCPPITMLPSLSIRVWRACSARREGGGPWLHNELIVCTEVIKKL